MMVLNDDEIKIFARDGYLIKRNVLDPDLMARARECMWKICHPPWNVPEQKVGSGRLPRWLTIPSPTDISTCGSIGNLEGRIG